MLEYIASADVGVLICPKNASLNVYYSLPNKFFEYLLAGIPVVASDFPEMRKIIRKYDVGCVVDPHNPRGIAEGIKSILSDEGRYLQMKENTRKVLEDYNWGKESKKLLRAYEELRS
jgi:glycosyltransferase involved in cell wall biosynthesis